MKQLTKLVSVKKIICETPASTFNSDDVESLAKLMIEAEMVVYPIILEQTGLNEYKLINGAIQYHAAVRAKQIDLLKGEVVQAVVVTGEANELNLLKQVALIQNKGI
jgi:hypothetical protein